MKKKKTQNGAVTLRALFTCPWVDYPRFTVPRVDQFIAAMNAVHARKAREGRRHE